MSEDVAAQPSSRPVSHEIGADLAAVSLDELADRILLLEREIERLREEEGRKHASRAQASAFFRS